MSVVFEGSEGTDRSTSHGNLRLHACRMLIGTTTTITRYFTHTIYLADDLLMMESRRSEGRGVPGTYNSGKFRGVQGTTVKQQNTQPTTSKFVVTRTAPSNSNFK
jgi:hypothetical protein